MEVGWLLERRLKPLGGFQISCASTSALPALLVPTSSVLVAQCFACILLILVGYFSALLYFDFHASTFYRIVFWDQHVRNSMAMTTLGSPSEDLPVKGPQDAGAHIMLCLLSEKRK